MSDLSKSMMAASQGMTAQSFRLRVVSENLSNADTHGYERKLVNFENVYNQKTGDKDLSVGPVQLDRSPGELTYDPGNPLAGQNGFVTSSNVNMMIELADAREASRSYEANLTTFRQATQMYSSLISLLRR